MEEKEKISDADKIRNRRLNMFNQVVSGLNDLDLHNEETRKMYLSSIENVEKDGLWTFEINAFVKKIVPNLTVPQYANPPPNQQNQQQIGYHQQQIQNYQPAAQRNQLPPPPTKPTHPIIMPDGLHFYGPPELVPTAVSEAPQPQQHHPQQQSLQQHYSQQQHHGQNPNQQQRQQQYYQNYPQNQYNERMNNEPNVSYQMHQNLPPQFVYNSPPAMMPQQNYQGRHIVPIQHQCAMPHNNYAGFQQSQPIPQQQYAYAVPYSYGYCANQPAMTQTMQPSPYSNAQSYAQNQHFPIDFFSAGHASTQHERPSLIENGQMNRSIPPHHMTTATPYGPAPHPNTMGPVANVPTAAYAQNGYNGTFSSPQRNRNEVVANRQQNEIVTGYRPMSGNRQVEAVVTSDNRRQNNVARTDQPSSSSSTRRQTASLNANPPVIPSSNRPNNAQPPPRQTQSSVAFGTPPTYASSVGARQPNITSRPSQPKPLIASSPTVANNRTDAYSSRSEPQQSTSHQSASRDTQMSYNIRIGSASSATSHSNQQSNISNGNRQNYGPSNTPSNQRKRTELNPQRTNGNINGSVANSLPTHSTPSTSAHPPRSEWDEPVIEQAGPSATAQMIAISEEEETTTAPAETPVSLEITSPSSVSVEIPLETDPSPDREEIEETTPAEPPVSLERTASSSETVEIQPKTAANPEREEVEVPTQSPVSSETVEVQAEVVETTNPKNEEVEEEEDLNGPSDPLQAEETDVEAQVPGTSSPTSSSASKSNSSERKLQKNKKKSKKEKKQNDVRVKTKEELKEEDQFLKEAMERGRIERAAYEEKQRAAVIAAENQRRAQEAERKERQIAEAKRKKVFETIRNLPKRTTCDFYGVSYENSKQAGISATIESLHMFAFNYGGKIQDPAEIANVFNGMLKFVEILADNEMSEKEGKPKKYPKFFEHVMRSVKNYPTCEDPEQKARLQVFIRTRENALIMSSNPDDSLRQVLYHAIQRYCHRLMMPTLIWLMTHEERQKVLPSLESEYVSFCFETGKQPSVYDGL
ncbi:unnamed protein product [Caenorhabditis sp. 36 PRJEB53466]|nr:unnamed protein product [Caenorhabditis sp. 36 PRJEB53466]